jgi:hypothetical protein
MPPRGTTENRIGLGIGYDDPGDSTLRYLREVNTAARELMQTFKGMGTLTIQVPNIPKAEFLSAQNAEAQKRRISDLANHEIAEGRRVSDVMTQLASKTDAELKRMALAYETTGHTNVADEIQRMLQQRSGGAILGQNLTAEDRAILEQARNPDPNRYFTGQHLGWPAKKGEPAEGTPQRPPMTTERARAIYSRTIDAEGRELTPEEEAAEFRRKVIAQHQAGKAKRGIVEEYEFEQNLTRPVGSLEREEAARIETDAQMKERKRQMNERINARAAQLETRTHQDEADRDSQSRGFRTQAEERQYAVDMQRRVAESEKAAERRYGTRVDPQEQLRRQQERVVEAEIQGQLAPQKVENAAWRRQQAAEEMGRINEEAARRRKAREDTQWERDLENRVAQERLAREGARERTGKRDDRAAYDELARGERPQYGPDVPQEIRSRNEAERRRQAKLNRFDDTLPQQGPEVPTEIRIANTEAAKKAQNEIRSEVRKSQQTFDEFSAQAGKDLDSITQKSSSMASQFSTQSRRYSGQMQQDARQTAAAFNTLFMRAEALRAELGRPTNMRRSAEEIEQELRQIRGEMERTIAESQKLKISMAQQGPENPWENSPRQRGLFGYGGHGGPGSAIATMIQYGGIYRGINAMESLISTSLANAKAQSEAESMMATATAQAGLLANENEKIVRSLQTQAGLSRTIGLQAVATATRFATSAGMPGDTGDIARIITNMGVSHGVTAEGIPALIDSAMKERGRFSQEYLGKTQEKIYYDYALRNRQGLEAGYPGSRTIQQDVSSLSDMEKRRAIIEEIEKRQGEFANAQATREASLAGKAERSAQAWNDITSAMGRFILTSRPLIKILDTAAGLLGSVAPDTDKPGSGPGGMLTEQDIIRRSRESVGTGAASASAGGLLRAASDVTLIRPIYELIQGIRGGGAEHFGRAVPFAGAYYAAYKDQQIETEQEYNKRLQKVFDERIKMYHEVQAAEANINKVEPLLGGQLQGQLAAGFAPENPFVKQMAEMDGISTHIKDTWGGFSKYVQEGMTQLETGNVLFETQKSRVDVLIASQKELTEARKLELDATIEITAQDERNNRVLQSRLKAAEQIPKLYLEERELMQGRAATPFQREQVGRESLHRIMQLMPIGFGPDGQLTPRPGRREQERIFDQAVRGFTDQYPMEWVRSSQDPLAREIRNQRIMVDRRERSRLWEDVDVEMRRAQVGGQAAEDASKLLQQLPALQRRSLKEGAEKGLTGDALSGYVERVKSLYNSDILAITGSLGANELTPELRKARIDALREDAGAKIRFEQEAQTTRIKMVTFLALIYGELANFKDKVGKGYENDVSTNPEGEPEKRAQAANMVISVVNETTARINGSMLKQLPGTGILAAATADSRQNRTNPWGFKIQSTMQGAASLENDPFAGLKL